MSTHLPHHKILVEEIGLVVSELIISQVLVDYFLPLALVGTWYMPHNVCAILTWFCEKGILVSNIVQFCPIMRASSYFAEITFVYVCNFDFECEMFRRLFDYKTQAQIHHVDCHILQCSLFKSGQIILISNDVYKL